MTLTVSIQHDLRPALGPVRDQGQRPTCLAFAASDAHAQVRGERVALSCEFAFYHAQRRGGRLPTQGATLPHMLNALREDGQPIEAGWPYLVSLPSDLAEWRPPAGATPLFGRRGSALPVSVAAIRSELASGRAVVALLRLSDSFFSPDLDGVVHAKPSEPIDTPVRHAVVVVAEGDVGGRSALLVRNSWGAAWGKAGHAWITEEYMGPRLFGAAILTDDVDVYAHRAAA